MFSEMILQRIIAGFELISGNLAQIYGLDDRVLPKKKCRFPLYKRSARFSFFSEPKRFIEVFVFSFFLRRHESKASLLIKKNP